MSRKRKYRSSSKRNRKWLWVMGGIVLLFIVATVAVKAHHKQEQKETEVVSQQLDDERPDMKVDLLTINSYSRPGISMEKVKGIVIHYTANPGTDAMQNRDYFEGLKDSHVTKASSHFIIGLDGEIVQCIPTAEISYASNGRNKDTISIECCHETSNGKFNDQTYDSLVKLTVWLMRKFSLEPESVIRHYDVTGKICPRYFVEHPKEWKKFQKDIEEELKIETEEGRK